MKAFKTLLVVIPALILVVLIVLSMPKYERFVVDEAGNDANLDEPTLVNNSIYKFFYRDEQLSNFTLNSFAQKGLFINLQSKTPAQVVDTVVDDTVSESIIHEDEGYTGALNLVIATEQTPIKDTQTDEVIGILDEGEIRTYLTKTANGYLLEDGGFISGGVSDIILNQSVFGLSSSVPHRLELENTYYSAFTKKGDEIYYEFTSKNEYVSIVLSNLNGRVDYILYNENFKAIKNGWNNSSSQMEIKYRGSGADKYYLKISGSYAEGIDPFTISFPNDDNEWNFQMQYIDLAKEVTGKFDYYGDEDFFVLPFTVTSNINKSVVVITDSSSDVNVTVYDKDHNMLGRYLYKKGSNAEVSMYGLQDAYAISISSFDGESSGTSYTFSLELTNVSVLDIETYGFALSPKYSDNEDYYTATVSSINDKRIENILFPANNIKYSISLTQPTKKVVTNIKLGEQLPLLKGRNILEITLDKNGATRVITIVITDKTGYNLSTTYTISAGNVYENAGSGSKTAISKYKQVLLLGESKQSGGKNYQKIAYNYGTDSSNSDYSYYKNTGWIDSKLLFSYDETEMPESYKSAIDKLKAAHPNWKFKFVDVGVSLSSYVNSQYGSQSMIYEDGKYVAATKEQIEYYVDPRNFLNEKSIFMFENQQYTGDDVYSSKGVLSVWNDSTVANNIMEAAKSTGLSPYFIVARAALESGRGTSALASGTVSGYEGYYNYFGIGAVDSNPLIGGASYAKQSNWNTKRKAMIEGSAWMKDQYVACMQNTIYFFKYSFVPNRSWHQYMTDIAAPSKDALNYYNAHNAGGTLNSEIEFIIPVFSDMK